MSEKVTTFLILNGESVFKTYYLGVQFSLSVLSDSLWTRGLQHARLPCPLPTPGACSDLCPSSRWCHPTISSSVVPFSSCLQSFPVSGSFQMSQLFASGGQAKLLEFQLQHQSFQWYTGLISLRIDWLDLLAVQGLAVQYSGVFSPLNDCQKTGVYKNLLFKKLIFTYLIVRNILAYKNIPMRIISMGLSLLKI